MTTIPTIETARLRLRPYRESDVIPYAKYIFSDPDVMLYMNATGTVPMMPRFHAEQLIHNRMKQWVTHGFGAWVLENRDDGHFMGHCGLFIIENTNVVEIGYALAKPFWGKGYATEAARPVLRYAFEVVKLERVVAVAFAKNVKSLRVMEKVGMQKRGLTREFYGVELMYYELTRADYATNTANQTTSL